MTDYPAHIVARAETRLQGYPYDKNLWDEMCEALMETVPEPVDPDLLLAREAAAQEADQHGWTETEHYIRTGEMDAHEMVQSALRALKMRPIPAPVSEERMMEMAREVTDGWYGLGSIRKLTDLALAGIKRGLAERGEGA